MNMYGTKMKYIAVTGGVVSGLGKGITISSIGVLLKACGLRVTSIKIDPYLNTDAGTMSPFEHGEVFVLSDGGEADLDLGNYERFLNIKLTRDHNLTTGKIYSYVIGRERRGDYLGKTVQVVPHVTDAIQDWIQRVARIPTDFGDDDDESIKPEVCLIEVGGTVGDIESMIFLEALRQFQFRVGPENFALVHVSLIPTVGGEMKTKPTQHSVKELRSLGLSPNLIVCRSSAPLDPSTCAKLAMFCHVPAPNIIAVHDLPNLYHVPLLLNKHKVAEALINVLNLEPHFATPQLSKWSDMAYSIDMPKFPSVKIALVGKYTGFQDAYLSVTRALSHSGIQTQRTVEIEWIEASALENSKDPDYEKSWSRLRGCKGVVVPGGFGDRGFQGKILAVQYCRENKVPFLGICLGMQAAVCEYARNVLHFKDATSQEFKADTEYPVVIYMPEIDQDNLGGTMRLGQRTTTLFPLTDGSVSLAQDVYGRVAAVSERHRHRYEVNPKYIVEFEKKGLYFTGRDTQQGEQRMEIAELSRDVHPYFFCCQYHPEFQSFPHAPSPPFWGLVLAAANELELPFPEDTERGVFKGVVPGKRAGTPPATPSRSPFPSPYQVTQTLSELMLDGTPQAQTRKLNSEGVKRKLGEDDEE